MPTVGTFEFCPVWKSRFEGPKETQVSTLVRDRRMDKFRSAVAAPNYPTGHSWTPEFTLTRSGGLLKYQEIPNTSEIRAFTSSTPARANLRYILYRMLFSSGLF
jgi:hypothetical protein